MTSGLFKGPASCHLMQDDDAILAANTFLGIHTDERILESDEW